MKTPIWLVEAFVWKYSHRTTANGKVVLATNGDSLLLEAYKVLGWSDPHDPSTGEAAS